MSFDRAILLSLWYSMVKEWKSHLSHVVVWKEEKQTQALRSTLHCILSFCNVRSRLPRYSCPVSLEKNFLHAKCESGENKDGGVASPASEDAHWSVLVRECVGRSQNAMGRLSSMGLGLGDAQFLVLEEEEDQYARVFELLISWSVTTLSVNVNGRAALCGRLFESPPFFIPSL